METNRAASEMWMNSAVWKQGDSTMVNQEWLIRLKEHVDDLDVPPPFSIDPLNLHLAFKGALQTDSWSALIAVECEKKYLIFKNLGTRCIGSISVSYALKDFLLDRFPIVLYFQESADYYSMLIACRKNFNFNSNPPPAADS